MLTQYEFDHKPVIAVLNQLLESELSGVVRYTHYSFMVFGPNRLSLVTWFRQQASESMLHSQQVGELITHLGGRPSLHIGELPTGYTNDTDTILKEALAHEHRALALYRDLLELVKDKSVLIEEFARQQISEEETHTGEIAKMLGPTMLGV
jgi:bacterioferritin